MVPILKFKLSFTDFEPKPNTLTVLSDDTEMAHELVKYLLLTVLHFMILSLFLNFKLHLYLYRFLGYSKIPSH